MIEINGRGLEVQNQTSNYGLLSERIAYREDRSLLRHHAPAAVLRQGMLVCAAVLTMSVPVAEARLQGPPRGVFIDNNFDSCVRGAKRHPVARSLPQNIVTRICTCSANYAADRLTSEDHAIFTYGNAAERNRANLRVREYSRQGLNTCKRIHKAS